MKPFVRVAVFVSVFVTTTFQVPGAFPVRSKTAVRAVPAVSVVALVPKISATGNNSPVIFFTSFTEAPSKILLPLTVSVTLPEFVAEEAAVLVIDGVAAVIVNAFVLVVNIPEIFVTIRSQTPGALFARLNLPVITLALVAETRVPSILNPFPA